MSTTRIGDFRQTEGDDGLFALAANGSATVSTTSARSAYDLIVDDLNNLYTTLLKRSADKPGLDWWASQVSAGNASIADVANEFRNSAEYKVVTAYNDVLGRYPEEAGLNWWVDQASKQNLTVDQLKKELSKTPELISKQLAPLQSKWDAEVANQEQPGIQTDIKTGEITFGGDSWDAYRVPNGGLIIQKMNADQSNLGKNQYRADILNPDTGEVTTQVVNRSQMPTIGRNITLGLMALAALNPGLFDIAGTAGSLASTTPVVPPDGGLLSGGLSAESLAALDAVGKTAIPEIVTTTGGLLDASLAATVPATVTPPSSGPSLTVTSTPLPPPSIIPPEIIAGGLAATTLLPTGEKALTDVIANTDKLITTPTTPTVVPPVVPTTPTTPTTTPTTTTVPTPTTPTVPGFDYTKLFTGLGDSLLKGFTGIADTLLGGLAGGNQSNAVAGLISAGIGYQQAKEAADALLQQGQISQQQYNALASNIQGQYNTLGNQFSGMAGDVRQTYNLLSSEAGQNVGEFTPYGITKNLFGPAGENIQASAMRAAQQSFDQAGMTNVDQLSQDYYNKLAALSAPEQQRQRLATEERLRAQGRLGVSGAAYGGTSPELLAQEQAIAQQQLQRELQSRQAALGERGTLLSQGTAALQPATQLGQFGLNTAQQQFANDLLRQQYLTGLKSQGVQGEIALRSRAGDLAARGIESAGVLQRQGLQDALSRQLAATAARSGANQQLTQSLFGGATGGTSSGGSSLFGSLLSSMFAPSDTVPGLNMTYAEALSKGLIAP